MANDTQVVGKPLKVILSFGLIILLLMMCSCTSSISDSNQPAGSESSSASSISQTETARYLVNVRNSTKEERLSNTVVNLLIRSGFPHGEGFDFDTGRAYDHDYPLDLRGSFIVIPKDRDDLREIALSMREILGVGAIIEENSSVDGWRYSGDILIVLGEDCLISSKDWVLWSSDYQDYSTTQQVKYWVSIRNATTQNLLADSTMRILDSAGFTYTEGYSYTLGNAYQGDSPLRLEQSCIVIKENRNDLRKIAEDMQEVIGINMIIEANSGSSWIYDGDILIVLGSDYLA